MITLLAEIGASPRRKLLQPGAGSLMAHCARLVAQDALWLRRLDPAPPLTLDGTYHDDHIPDWEMWRRDRQALDARLHEWSTRLRQPDLEGELFWYSELDHRAVSRPFWLCVSHLFASQSEGRGIILGQLSQAGLRIDSGDLIGLPHDLDWM